MRPSLTERVVLGVAALAVGQAASLAIQCISSVILARRLDPAEFGTFAVVLFVVALAQVLSGFGQGTVLVQRPGAVREGEWRTSFTLQLIGAAGVSLLLLALAPLGARVFDLGEDFVRALTWGVPMVMLAPVERLSTAALERRMAYGAISAISMAGGVLYAGVAVSLAWHGFGFWSLIGGALAASIGRTLLSAILARGPLGVGLERGALLALWRSGRPCQCADLFGFLREHTPPLVAGPIFGPTAVGYLVWARNLAYVSYHVFAAAFMRVGFSLVARAPESEGGPPLGRLIEGMAFASVSLMTIPLVLLLGLAHPVIAVIYTEKWMPALPALYLFGIRMLGGAVLGLFAFFVNGMGQFSLASRSVIVWTALEVGAALVLAPRLGFHGIAAASALAVWGPAFWLVRRAQALLSARAERVRVGEALGKPVLVGGVVGGLLREIGPHVADLQALILAAALGLTVYVLVLGWWSDVFRQLVRSLWAHWMRSAKAFSPAGRE
jgi:PST family polysaccharide transporter